MDAAAGGLGQQTLRLLASDASAVAPRFELLERYAAGQQPLADLLVRCAAWPAIEDWLLRTLRERRPTLVYGDYDVDGATASFLMFRWLRSQSVPCNFFLPSRFKHGYGLDAGIVRQAQAQGYAQLLVLDCGTANLEELELARELGLEAVVIDHHTPLDRLPDALLLNPHCEPMLPPLCTAGLVYAVLQRLDLLLGSAPTADALELAGLATLADVVPLEPHNWALAHLALLRMPETLNWGLGELVRAARLDGLDRLTARQASFGLIPRLNAAGRMANARLIVELFDSDGRNSARLAVQRLEQLNSERRLQTERVEAEAARQALQLDLPPALGLYDADWHPGVLGIVAARIAERFERPTAVLGQVQDSASLLSGSARAGHGQQDVLALLRACQASLVSCGGHAQAAGLKLELAALEDFRAAFAQAALAQEATAQQTQELDPPARPISGLTPGELSAQLEQDVWALAPFGPGWPALQVRIEGCRLLRAGYMGQERTHASLTLTDGRAQLRVAAFKQSQLVTQLRPGEELRPLVELEPDNWNNVPGLSLRLLALD